MIHLFSNQLFNKLFLVASIALLFSLAACDEDEATCEVGDRLCLDEGYVMMCELTSRNEPVWFSALCANGCKNNGCVDNKYAHYETTDCQTGTDRCLNSVLETCVDGLWFKSPYENSFCIPEEDKNKY